MWFLIRSAVGLVVLGLAAYTLFFVQLAGKPLASHAVEVWSSEVVQEKVGMLRDGMRDELEDRLAKAAHDGRGTTPRPEELAEHDRHELEKTLQDLQTP